jgi:Response regulator containing CheY-like receiver, AAA-type ATPase, and DNA-binding domains
MSKILVVDDDHDILTVVKILLNMNNFSVKTISKWEYISEEIQKFSPDLILLDVALGSADGREICKKLKKSEETNHIPVILFSAHYDLVNNIGGCMADGLVTKPFETSYLLDTIRKNLQNTN